LCFEPDPAALAAAAPRLPLCRHMGLRHVVLRRY
jgi:hypothetical protein